MLGVFGKKRIFVLTEMLISIMSLLKLTHKNIIKENWSLKLSDYSLDIPSVY